MARRKPRDNRKRYPNAPRSKRIRNNPYAVKGRYLDRFEGGLVVRKPDGSVLHYDDRGNIVKVE